MTNFVATCQICYKDPSNGKSGKDGKDGANGKDGGALIDAERLDYYHQLETERIHLLLINQANNGLDDIAAARTQDAREAIGGLRQQYLAKHAG